MTTPEQTPSPDYTRGFNEGYILSEHMPDLADSLSKAVHESERGMGFKDGREQYVFEHEKERAPDWLPRNRSKDTGSHDPQKDDKTKDMDRE